MIVGIQRKKKKKKRRHSQNVFGILSRNKEVAKNSCGDRAHTSTDSWKQNTIQRTRICIDYGGQPTSNEENSPKKRRSAFQTAFNNHHGRKESERSFYWAHQGEYRLRPSRV